MMINALLATAVVSANLFAPNLPVQDKVMAWKGKPAPKFSMKAIDGKVHTNASLKGKVVLLDFWATWCGPCKAASPSMQNLHKKHASKGLVVVGANGWESGPKGPDVNNPSYAKKYATEHKYSYVFTYGNDPLMKTLGMNGIPTFVLIDRKGVIREVWTGFGPRSEATMEAAIGKLLAQK